MLQAILFKKMGLLLLFDVCLVEEGEAWMMGEKGVRVKRRSEGKMVRKKEEHIYGERERDSCLVRHRNHAFSFVRVGSLFISPTLINECT